MKRREIKIKASDGNDYIFRERNKEDYDLFAIETKLRKYNLGLIQEAISDEDKSLALMMHEMKRRYNEEELKNFIIGSPNVQIDLAYKSFKLANPDVGKEKFTELFKSKIKSVLEMLTVLESGENNKKKAAAKD